MTRQCCDKKLLENTNTHTPKIGRGPKTPTHDKNTPIGDYLYSRNQDIKSLLMTKISKEIDKDKIVRNKSYIHKNSKEIVENMKTASFIKIFRELDNDNDGVISGDEKLFTGI